MAVRGSGNMTFDEKARIVELVFTAIGLLFVIFGWVIPYRQALKENAKRKKFEEDLIRRQWEKEFIDKQISEFYGPISAILNELEISFSLILNQLGRERVFEEDKKKVSDLSRQERLIWLHYVRTYKIPAQNEIVRIMKSNQHLIYQSQIPICFTVFLKYATYWDLMDKQKINKIPNEYEYYDTKKFPKTFTKYINYTLNILLKRQLELIEQKD